MFKWTDNSSWSRKDTKEDRKTPKSWQANIGQFRLKVHHNIYYPPEVWLASCNGLFSQVELKSQDAYEAKLQAVSILQMILKTALEDIEY